MKNFVKGSGLLFSLAALIMSGCSGGAVKNVSLEQNFDKKFTGLAMHYKITAEGAQIDGCELGLTNLTTQEVTMIALETSQGFGLYPMKAGDYRIQLAKCPSRKEIENIDLFPKSKIEIRTGRVSYFGEVTFDFDSVKNTLTFTHPPRDEQEKGLAKIFTDLPPALQETVFAVFTQKRISRNLFKYLATYTPGLNCSQQGSGPGSIPDVVEKVNSCWKKEQELNPYAIGVLEYNLQYSGERNMSFKKKADANSYTSEFIACVEDMIKSSRTSTATEIECSFRM